MTRTTFSLSSLVGAGVLVLWPSESARAQAPGVPGQPSRPVVSPYLELNRPGDAGLNYYRRVRPELDLRAADAAQRTALGQLARRLERTEREAGLRGTGHPTHFMNYSHYFQFSKR